MKITLEEVQPTKQTSGKDIPLNQIFTGSIGIYPNHLFKKIRLASYANEAHIVALDSYNEDGTTRSWYDNCTVTDYKPCNLTVEK